ncbi:MAG: thymidine phosphorylase [Ignavibacteriaceae bacterium]|nr:thymidine phosphorylase [Ignavibacteriaceae bacterium]
MNTVELIKKKREGNQLSEEEIEYLIGDYSIGKIPDYQFAAFLMAVYLRGMTKMETARLTRSMLNSGKVISLKEIPGKKIDKHSTGGVGDKTSLIIAPIVTSLGINVPMISGRGLGHTGGTLDKLESIPGFRTDLSLSRYKSVLKKCGAVLIGQTKEIAPADKLIYALRDVTATVESIPLITGSIMSKKLAGGVGGLVLDVKTGSGAFMKEQKDALALANSLMDTAKAFNKKVIAFITDMNQPLGNYIGNWLEVYETVKVLKGEKEGDVLALSLELAGAMIYLGNKASSIKEGAELAKEQIKNGKAFDKFLQIVKLQGGDIGFLIKPELYPKAKYSKKVVLNKQGFVKAIDNYRVGMASLELGAGRKTKEDIIDPTAGIIFNVKISDGLKNDSVIAYLHSSSLSKIRKAEQILKSAIDISKSKVGKPKLIKKIIH